MFIQNRRLVFFNHTLSVLQVQLQSSRHWQLNILIFYLNEIVQAFCSVFVISLSLLLMGKKVSSGFQALLLLMEMLSLV